MGLPRGLMVSLILILAFRTPIVSSNVMALILSDAKMASLSAKVGSSLEGTLADKITHISQRLTLTALRSARLKGDPWKVNWVNNWGHNYLMNLPNHVVYYHGSTTVVPQLYHGNTIIVPWCTPGKNNLFRKSNTRDNELRHENGWVKSSSQLWGEHCKCLSNFFPSECPGLCWT